MKASSRYRIFWLVAIILALLAMVYLIVPPLVPLGRFRPYFASALSNEIGAPVTVAGDVKLSLLGHPMIAVEDVRFGDISIKSVRFRISWASVFNLSGARIASGIKVSGLSMDAKTLAVPDFGKKILISDSLIRFMGRDYEIIDGWVEGKKLFAGVRTDQHKYMVETDGENFAVTNPNEDLTIRGKLSSGENGSVGAAGTFAIAAADINRWFGFAYPEISGKTKLSMNFVWDGKGFFDFSKIAGTNGKMSFAGRVRLWHDNGVQTKKSVRMRIENANLDLSFLKGNPGFLYNSNFGIRADGNITLPSSRMKNIRSLVLQTSSASPTEIDIKSLRADGDDLSISASGKVIGDSADNLDVAIYQKNPEQSLTCLLSGNSERWRCERWSFTDKNAEAGGMLHVSPDDFQMLLRSANMRPDIKSLDMVKKYAGGRNGSIEFSIGGMSGVAEMIDGRERIEYVHENTDLSALPVALPLPKTMMRAKGNLSAVVRTDKASFSFDARDWSLVMDGTGAFSIEHNDFRKFLGLMTNGREMPFLKSGIHVKASGKYARPVAHGLDIRILGMAFSGMANGGNITLDTKLLDLDGILDQKWFDNFIDNQYLFGDPILAPFDLGISLAVSADGVRLGGKTYAGFVYSLGQGSQKMSITDSENGRMLGSISKNKSKYGYLVQLNKFFFPGKLFGISSPVNFEGATVTAEASLESMGLTAYDIRRNMTGIIDASVDGGYISGLGTDGFYDNANRLGKSDTENALSAALSGGRTAVKEMHITGEYSGGDFRTTKPFMLSARHADVTGNISVRNDSPAIRANIILRGTSPIPKPIALVINASGRDFSLSEILADVDLDYLREFVRTHKKF